MNTDEATKEWNISRPIVYLASPDGHRHLFGQVATDCVRRRKNIWSAFKHVRIERSLECGAVHFGARFWNAARGLFIVISQVVGSSTRLSAETLETDAQQPWMSHATGSMKHVAWRCCWRNAPEMGIKREQMIECFELTLALKKLFKIKLHDSPISAV